MKKEDLGLCEIKGDPVGLHEIEVTSAAEFGDAFLKKTTELFDQKEAVIALQCSCKQICGIRIGFKAFFTKDSPIMFKFPMGKTKEWSYDLYKHHFSKVYDQEIVEKRKIDWSHVKPEDLH